MKHFPLTITTALLGIGQLIVRSGAAFMFDDFPLRSPGPVWSALIALVLLVAIGLLMDLAGIGRATFSRLRSALARQSRNE